MRFTWFISVYKISIFLYTIAINIELLYFKEYGNNYSFFFCSDTCFMFLFISENCSVVRSTILSLSAVYCMHVCVWVSVRVLCFVYVCSIWRFDFRFRTKGISFPKSIKGTFLKHTVAAAGWFSLFV